MPKSHDQKARNRWRRVKGANPVPFASTRPKHRRLLHALAMVAHERERDIRAVLAFEGKTWRWYERATRTQIERIEMVAVARMKSDTLRVRPHMPVLVEAGLAA